ncbi:hypothetical protein [Vibrio sp. ZOR0018]|uniref:hypothetical protein n=1 Tax=Vibrio sp. ZOR0018 TaxID=1339225 RepID=UPI0012E05844|nr:hypothetical protein [Vibrio sp. ZOR0018]
MSGSVAHPLIGRYIQLRTSARVISMEYVSNEGFWAILGAVIGAFLGAFLGLMISAFLDYKRYLTLERSLYQEADFISSMMSSFFISVIKNYNSEQVNLYNGERLIGPREINFDAFYTLHLELYKTKSIPNEHHRRLIHNISYQWDRVLSLDLKRITKLDDKPVYYINKSKSIEIINILVNSLYNMDMFVKRKSRFKFDDKRNFKFQARAVFNKYNVNDSELIDLISDEIENW